MSEKYEMRETEDGRAYELWQGEEKVRYFSKPILPISVTDSLNLETAPLLEALEQEKKAHAYDIEQARLGFEAHEAKHEEQNERIAELEAALGEIAALQSITRREMRITQLADHFAKAIAIAENALSKGEGDE